MKWEYLIIIPHIDRAKRNFAFNSLGQEGYELVAIQAGMAYFKRPASMDLDWLQKAEWLRAREFDLKIYSNSDDVDRWRAVRDGVVEKYGSTLEEVINKIWNAIEDKERYD